MDITVYLPDELGQRAKAENVNLSRLLRDTLEAQFREDDTVAAVLDDAAEFTLELENEDGIGYRGRFRGTLIAQSESVEVYVTDSGNVLVYDPDKLKYWTETPDTDLDDLIGDQDVYLQAMAALGREGTIDLDV